MYSLRLVKFHSPAFFSSSTSQRPHVNWKIQSPQHDEAEHQSIDSVLLESGQDAGLGVPAPAAVLCRPGALPQTWAERWHSFSLFKVIYSDLLWVHPTLLLPLFSAKKSFIGQNKSIWGPLELVEKLCPESADIATSARDLPGIKYAMMSTFQWPFSNHTTI